MNPILKNVVRNAGALVAQGLSLLPGEVPKTVVIELKGAYPMTRPSGPLPVPIPIPGQPKIETLTDLQHKLELLAKVPSLEGIVFLNRGYEGGLATTYAVRRLIETFRASGKRVTLYADSVDNATLYLGSACDEFAMLSEGIMGAVGLGSRVVFVGEMLKKIGINLEYERRSEYKAAPERLTTTGFSDTYRESVTALLESVYDHWLETIASGRTLEIGALRAAIDAAPMMADEALQRGLLTRVAFEDELTLHAKPALEAMRFSPPEMRWDDAGSVALVSLEGGISDGESRNVPLPIPFIGGKQAGGYTIARALRAAAQDKNVKAIVFHVDSPGGSALASELIWREVSRAKAIKPVVAVMGELAASGGYYVSCNATRILAAPSTITGSIGVFNLHPDNTKLWERLGFTPETIKLARHADYGSPDRVLSPSERDNMSRMVERIYDTFKARVAAGRGMSAEQVEAVAKGRIWSGTQGLERNLVDEIGTVFDGIRLAKRLAGLPETSSVVNITPPAKYIAPTDLAALAKTLEVKTHVWAALPDGLEVR
jgi:protease IV